MHRQTIWLGNVWSKDLTKEDGGMNITACSLQVSRILQPNGVYIAVSHGQPSSGPQDLGGFE